MKYLTIVNPRSGCLKSVRKILASIQHRMITSGNALDIFFTDHRGDAEHIAHTKDYTGYDALLVFGGDGTIHEVANGMLSREDGQRLPLGVVPVGTGNSLMRDFGCTDPDTAITRILSGSRRAIDVLKMDFDNQCRYGINLVGCGLPALVNAYAEKMRPFGAARYNLASLLAIITYKPFGLTFFGCELNGTLSSDFILGSNTAHIGRGLKVSPGAVVDDGLLDLFALQPTSRWDLIKLFGQLIRGTHLNNPKVHHVTTDGFGVESAAPGTMLNIDGENYHFSRMQVSVLAKEIDLLV